MYSKVFATLAIAATLAAATVTPVRRNDSPSNQCNTGSVQCCDSTQDAQSSALSAIFALLGISAQDVSGLVGVTCSPITVIGASGTSCSAQPVCCTDNSFNGIVALGCTPVNLNL